MVKYRFRHRFAFGRVDPHAAGVELARLAAEHGTLTPDLVLAAAQDESSVLHDAFEWNDGEAAHRWRLHQARQMIASVEVIRSEEQPPVLAFVSVTTDDGKRLYVDSARLIDDDELASRAMEEARKHVERAERRLSDVIRSCKRNRTVEEALNDLRDWSSRFFD